LDINVPFVTIVNFTEQVRVNLNFYFQNNPQTTLSADLDNLTTGPSQPFFQNDININSHIKQLSVVNQNQVTSIGGRFLFNCYRLTSIDLSTLNQVTSIGDGFLYNCYGLTSLDLSPLNQVTSIGDNFLVGCSSLRKVTLSKSMRGGIVHQKLLESHPSIEIEWITWHPY
jgi:hypothetical protein